MNKWMFIYILRTFNSECTGWALRHLIMGISHAWDNLSIVSTKLGKGNSKALLYTLESFHFQDQ